MAGSDVSKRLLADALRTLLQDHWFSEVTVTQICSFWINCFWNRRKITNTGMVIRVAKAKIWPQKMYTSVESARSARGRVR